jgi:hypothetical protein
MHNATKMAESLVKCFKIFGYVGFDTKIMKHLIIVTILTKKEKAGHLRPASSD